MKFAHCFFDYWHLQFLDMFSFLVLLGVFQCCWFITCQQETCLEQPLCLTNTTGMESECLQNNATENISNFTMTCTKVQIYVTSGIHKLQQHLTFTDNVKEVCIKGGLSKSTVECSKYAAIKFSENREANQVFLTNLTFTHCQLYFKYTSRLILQDVTIMNSEKYGIRSSRSPIQEIIHCTFINNALGHIHTYNSELVKIIESNMFESKVENAVYLEVQHNASIIIRSCKFRDNINGALLVKYANFLEITDSLITNNAGAGIYIDILLDDDVRTSTKVIIRNCSVENNRGIGITVQRDSRHNLTPTITDISNVTFANNSQGALYFSFNSWSDNNDNRVTKITGCTFKYHELVESSVVLIKNLFIGGLLENNQVLLENCLFERNKGGSTLKVDRIINFTISNVDIIDNQCTAIALVASRMKIENHLNLTRNSGRLGGGIALQGDSVLTRIRYSQLLLTNSSMVHVTENTAGTYGGGIYSNETCDVRNRNQACFLQFETAYAMPQLIMSGNRAQLGGDSALGGCLSNCSIEINKTQTTIDKTDPNNTFWTLVSTGNPLSQSTFVEYPTGATFCMNTTSTNADAVISCNKSHTVSVFRGQIFNVSVIAGDDFCYPTIKALKVLVEGNLSLLEQGDVLETRKYCQNYLYALAGGLNQNKTDIQFSFQDPFAKINVPAILTVILKDCPPGLKLEKSTQQCMCHNKFKSYKIVCHADRYTLEIPAQTWVGKYEGSIVAQKECQYCRNEMTEQPIDDTTNKLCTGKRSGIMCGECTQGYSLKLGGYECASCSKSPLVGVVLVVAFTCAGAILVFLLLRLNLTISTGALNGLIFYSNIVYLNNDIFLPTSKVGGVYLQNTVKILATFLAWMNLDFGISTCFFDGYNTYLSTWMQFAFPLYIWLLILIIVFASWYSTIVARITTSNTVPVLATLLLLSYAKLLKTSIEVFSSVRLFSIDGELLQIVWKQDGDIPYLGRYHILLFLMTLLMVIFYIVPFTLLVFLGPLMRAKSHYRMFRWIHKIKPFLDAFYGCYTIKYRYWPGLLLLTRVAIIGIFSSYFTNDSPFKLMTISMMVLVLFIFWMLIGGTTTTSFYRKRNFNYLELFFLSNLGTLSAVSRYTTQFTEKSLRNQQVLGIIMVGSAFLVFCAITAHQISQVLLRYRSIRIINDSVQAKVKHFVGYRDNVQLNVAAAGDTDSTAPVAPSYTEIDVRHSNKLRESLLTGN